MRLGRRPRRPTRGPEFRAAPMCAPPRCHSTRPRRTDRSAPIGPFLSRPSMAMRGDSCQAWPQSYDHRHHRPSNPGRHWFVASAKRNARCPASPMRGKLRTACEADFLAFGGQRRTNLFIFRCGHFQRQLWVYYAATSWVPHHIPTAYVIRSPPSRGVRVIPPAHK